MPIAVDGSPYENIDVVREKCYLKLKQAFTDFKDYYEYHSYFYSLKEMKKIEKHIKKLEELL